MSIRLPTYSVVVEWENARLSELGRTREMLRQLYHQIVESRHPQPEIIILHDKDHIDRRLVEEVVGEVAELRAWPAEVKIFPTEGLEYYEQKNFGADQSKSDLILFLDSDVVPEEGWLASLLETFQDPGVQVACGNTYIPPEGFYNKAFALFWFFPLRTKESGLRQTTDRYSKANNIAFRREVFETFRYPSLPTFRGQCAALRKTMGAYGIDTFLQQGARVSHPSPNGLRHFVKRAVCQGHDSVARYRLHEKSHTASLRHSFKWYLGNLRRSLKRISRHYRKVKLGPAGAVGAFGLAVFYYTLGFMGASLAIFRPDFVRRRFAI